MGNKQEEYLKQLEDIKRKSKLVKHEEYMGRIPKKAPINTLSEEEKFLKDEKVDSIENAARGLMQEGIDLGSVRYSLSGAQIYEKIGKGSKAIPGLLRALKNNIKFGYTQDLEDAYPAIKTFIEKNTKEKKQKTSGLEKKFGVFVAFIIGGVALSLGSLTITGNAISNLTGTTPGLLGIILFIAGLIGMFFYFKGK